MGAPNLEGEITSKITHAIIRYLRATKLTGHLSQSPSDHVWEADIATAVGAVVSEYFDGDVLLIKDTPVKGESPEAYNARAFKGGA